MAYNIGDRIGDYQIIDVLGAGGMGKVYKVRNVISERVEAMKVLLPNLVTDPDLVDRFMREIKVQASLQHPNIASLHTALRIDNQLIMLIEFVEGSTIESVLRQAPLPVPKATDYIKQVLLALQYAHSHGVIHRDIKPANMMLTPSGVVKLMDFGIAKLSQDRRLTQTGRTVGSLYYMSPEQIQGAEDLDPRADLYSLGVSLYEMVTGTRPFQGDSDYSIMAAHLNSQPVPPIQIDPTLPPVISDIILMAIAKNPEHRFATAEAFGRALESAEGELRSAGSFTKVIGGAVPMPATTAPLPSPSPLPVEAAAPSPQKSRRGMYMAIGSLVTVAVLAVVAMQGPSWFKGSAASTSPAQQQSQPALNQPTEPQPTPVTPERSPVAPPANVPIEPKRTPATTAAERKTSSFAQNQQSPQTAPTQTQIPQTQNPQTPPPQPTSQQQTPQQAPTVPSTPPAVDTAKESALRELRNQMTLLASRANSARATLSRMKDQQARQGLGMRGDVVTAEQRMENFLDDAQAALRAGDPDAAKKALQSAEREIDRLDTFLGR